MTDTSTPGGGSNNDGLYDDAAKRPFNPDGGEDEASVTEDAGSDTEAGEPTPENRDDAALEGRVVVSVDIEDDGLADEVRSAFEEFHAVDVAEE